MKVCTPNLALLVLDSILPLCIENPYVIIGYADGTIWRDRELISVDSAIKKALQYSQSHKRLQNLVLFAPMPKHLKDIETLQKHGVLLDIYVGENDKDSKIVLESFATFSVVRYYKNCSFNAMTF